MCSEPRVNEIVHRGTGILKSLKLANGAGSTGDGVLSDITLNIWPAGIPLVYMHQSPPLWIFERII